MWLRVLVLACLVTLVSSSVLADSTAEENWLIYERGNAAMSQGEFGNALNLFEQAIHKAGIFPEAEMQIGDIYMEEGEPALALSQYEKAYNERKSFIIPSMQYDVLYKSARVYEYLGQYRNMEDKLS